MEERRPTVVARLTPPGPSAVATIGILGPEATGIALRLFRGSTQHAPPARCAPGRPYYGPFGVGIQDDVVLHVVQEGPQREVRVHCHGGRAMVVELVRQIVAQGALLVSWQDYLRAAGSSEIQVEAAAALAECPSPRCAAILLDQLDGALERAMARLASHDPQSHRHRDSMEPPEAIDELRTRLLQWAPLGLHLVRAWRVLLVGRTNVGKSSLLNALAGFERALVSDRPGTTRDVLRVERLLEGWPVEFLDGAGFGPPHSDLEVQGQERIARERGTVDLCVLVFDLSRPWTPGEERLWRQVQPDVAIGNKCDLALAWNEEALGRLDLVCSARSGHQVDELGRRIASRLVPLVPAPGEALPFTLRQVDLIRGPCAGSAPSADIGGRLDRASRARHRVRQCQ